MASFSPYSPFATPSARGAGVFAPRSQSDEAYVTSLYNNLLGRQPDPQGFQAHLAALRAGASRQQVYQAFLTSDEFRQRRTAPAAPLTYGRDAFQPVPPTSARSFFATGMSMNLGGWFRSMFDRIKSWFRGPAVPPAPGPVPGPAPGPQPGSGLVTVPMRPEYSRAPIDRSNPAAAVLSAATWVYQTYPQYFNAGESRPVAYEMMTAVIGALRAHGFDAHRVVNYPSVPIGDPGRYGKDALVLNGVIYDCYQSWGDPGSRPQALAVGSYGDRPRE